jgi:hypothetical protein
MMVRENQDHGGPGVRAPEAKDAAAFPAQGVSLRSLVLLLAVAAFVTTAGVLGTRWWLTGGLLASGSEKETAPPDSAPAPAVRLFQGWDKPEFVLLLSAQQHGYLLPCGCSSPQRGGLERRYNLIQSLKQRGWSVVPLDLGDVAQQHGPQKLPNVQGLIKYRYSLEALKLMDYPAIGIGEYDAGLPLKEAIDNWALNEPRPRMLAANLQNKENNFPDEVGDFVTEPVKGTRFKLGVTGVVGPSVADLPLLANDPQAQFDPVRKALPVVLQKMARDKPDLRVLLYQGSTREARACAGAFQEFQVILCLCDDDEGSSQAEKVGATMIVSVGHKGKNVGVVGVFPGDKQHPFTLRYQQVLLGEEFKTPDDQRDAHPIVKLMERYTKELKDNDYLHKYGQSSHALQVAMAGVTPSYVGSDRCKKCHEFAYDRWKKSKHAHAYQTLVDVKQPGLRQYDGECVVCHVTGFGYKTGFVDDAATPKLKDVGCESCHGPASEHVRQPNNPQWHALLNPWKPKEKEKEEEKKQRTLLIDQACQKCHDPENDVHWIFDKRWPDVDHPTPAP